MPKTGAEYSREYRARKRERGICTGAGCWEKTSARLCSTCSAKKVARETERRRKLKDRQRRRDGAVIEIRIDGDTYARLSDAAGPDMERITAAASRILSLAPRTA